MFHKNFGTFVSSCSHTCTQYVPVAHTVTHTQGDAHRIYLLISHTHTRTYTIHNDTRTHTLHSYTPHTHTHTHTLKGTLKASAPDELPRGISPQEPSPAIPPVSERSEPTGRIHATATQLLHLEHHTT